MFQLYEVLMLVSMAYNCGANAAVGNIRWAIGWACMVGVFGFLFYKGV